MEKVKISKNAFVYPMPMVLVGAMIENRANFMAVAWITRVNLKPPLIAIGLGNNYTNIGIQEQKAFSINVPDLDLIEQVDYCGLVSGKDHDKSELFDIFYGELANAPMIQQCPVCMECTLVNTVEMPTNTLFIGEIVGAYSEERYLTRAKPDIKKINPFSLTMPDHIYWTVGENAGKAWGIGKKLKKKGVKL